MDAAEIRAELRVRSIEFEQALDRGLPPSQLREIYNKLKELQYQLTISEVRDRATSPAPPNNFIIE